MLFTGFSLLASWHTTSKKDAMTGKNEYYAVSSYVSPTRQMPFPYSNIQSQLIVGCTNKGTWSYFYFTEQPNIIKTENYDGYNDIKTRIKWGDSIENTVLRQKWGSKVISFYNDGYAINKIQISNNVMLELNWYGSDIVHFIYDLRGSSKAIATILAECSVVQDTQAKQEGDVFSNIKTLQAKSRKECEKLKGFWEWEGQQNKWICLAELQEKNIKKPTKQSCEMNGGRWQWDGNMNKWSCL